MQSVSWTRQHALITGASSGIGAALAERLAGGGASLLLTGRDVAALDRVAATCRDAGAPSVEVVVGDLADQGFVQSLAEVAAGQGLDLLILNAGVTMNALFAELAPDLLRRILEVNLLAPAELTRRLLPRLRERRGRIVVVSSLTGIVPPPTRSAYAASKHALHGLFGSIRIEERVHGVSVTIVCPGYVDTAMRHRALTADGSPQGFDQAEGRTMASAESVARATLAAAWRRRRLLLIGRETSLARVLSIVAPGLLDRLLASATR